MDIKSIDEALRAKAKEQLTHDVERAFQNLNRDLKELAAGSMHFGWIKLDCYVRDGERYNKIDGDDVVKMLIRATIENFAPNVEQAAVDAFLADVGRLRTEVDDLQSRIGG